MTARHRSGAVLLDPRLTVTTSRSGVSGRAALLLARDEAGVCRKAIHGRTKPGTWRRVSTPLHSSPPLKRTRSPVPFNQMRPPAQPASAASGHPASAASTCTSCVHAIAASSAAASSTASFLLAPPPLPQCIRHSTPYAGQVVVKLCRPRRSERACLPRLPCHTHHAGGSGAHVFVALPPPSHPPLRRSIRLCDWRHPEGPAAAERAAARAERIASVSLACGLECNSPSSATTRGASTPQRACRHRLG